MATPIYSKNYKARGEAVKYDSNVYSTAGMSYPFDLLSDQTQYGGNYVIFYVNVHEDSKLVKQNGDTSYVPAGTTMSQRGSAAQMSSTQIVSAAGVAGVAAATGANVAGRAVEAAGGSLTTAGKAVGNVGVAAIGVTAAIAAIGGAKKDYKRQVKAIALHVPTDLSIRYSASWDAEAMAGQMALGTAAGPAMAGALAGGLVGGFLKGKVGAIVGAATGAAIGGLASGAGNYAVGQALQAPGGQLVGKTTGTAANPKKEQLFREVDFRTFSFSYQFFPRNSDEAEAVRNIIREFKLHMHPEFKDDGGFLYIYPSEFDIVYYQNGKENMNIHRHTSCVLTDMSVSYAPQGTFSTFSDGMPTQVNIQLTFKELALLTKDNIQDGF